MTGLEFIIMQQTQQHSLDNAKKHKRHYLGEPVLSKQLEKKSGLNVGSFIVGALMLCSCAALIIGFITA